MAEYIERDYVILAVCKDICGANEPCGGVVCDLIDTLRHKATAADVAPVVHGRWIWNSIKGCFTCDQCGQISVSKRNFCHNCGAKMDKED